MTEDDEWTRWFEAAWEAREETVFRELFGMPEEGIYVLTRRTFERRFGDRSLDPRWFHHGVFVFPPNGDRQSWAYVSSGLSNAWEDDEPDPNGVSGLGVELLFETPERYAWAIVLVQEIVAYELLLASGAFEGRSPLDDYDRIPLRESIEPGGTSQLTHLLVAPSAWPQQQLLSGAFVVQQLVGISESEAEYARSHDGRHLRQLLAAAGAFPVTDPWRRPVW